MPETPTKISEVPGDMITADWVLEQWRKVTAKAHKVSRLVHEDGAVEELLAVAAEYRAMWQTMKRAEVEAGYACGYSGLYSFTLSGT